MELYEKRSLEALAWILCSAATALVLGRFWIRHGLSRTWGTASWGWNDFLTAAAASLLIAYTAVFQANLNIAYHIQLDGLGPDYSLPSQAQIVSTLKLQLATDLLFWLIIFLVKASFLATYWQVFSISRSFQVAWAVIALYTFISFWALFLSRLWACGQPSQVIDYSACTAITSSPAAYHEAEAVGLWWWMALNVAGDLLILVLPTGMIVNMHLSVAQKVGLAGIFGIILMDLLFDVLRTVFMVQNINAAPWAVFNVVAISLCEPAVAVIACALPSYQSLLHGPTKRSLPKTTADVTGYRQRKQRNLSRTDLELGDLLRDETHSLN